MAANRGENHRTLRVVVTWATAGGALYAVLAGTGGIGSNLIQGALTGGCVALPLAWFDMVFLYTALGERVRRASFVVAVLTKLGFYLAVIVIAIIANEMIFDRRSMAEAVSDPAFIGHVVFALIAAAFVNFLLMVRRMLGRRVLWNFITGRYHRPRSEQRAFLFIDLDGSTAAAERLGPMRFMELLSQFFFDISGPILECEGDVYQYVGDEVIVTWPLPVALRDANSVRCYFTILTRLNQLRLRYIESFGFFPRFHAALHVGTVAAGEIGDFKQEIVYVGDTLNTTARIMHVAKERGHPFMVSATMIEQLELPWDISAESIGPVPLRGKEEVVELYAVSRRA